MPIRFENRPAEGRIGRGLCQDSASTFHYVYAHDFPLGYYFQVLHPHGDVWRWNIVIPVSYALGDAPTEEEAQGAFRRVYDELLQLACLVEIEPIARTGNRAATIYPYDIVDDLKREFRKHWNFNGYVRREDGSYMPEQLAKPRGTPLPVPQPNKTVPDIEVAKPEAWRIAPGPSQKSTLVTPDSAEEDWNDRPR